MKKSEEIEFLILALLYNNQLTYGYQITKVVQQPHFKIFVGYSKASLYNALKKIVKNKYATCEEERIENFPPRTKYCLTEKGKEQIIKYVRMFLKEKSLASEKMCHFAIKFGFMFDKTEFLDLLKNRIEFYKKIIDNMTDKIKFLTSIYEKNELIKINLDYIIEHFNNEKKFFENIYEYVVNNENYKEELKQMKFYHKRQDNEKK